MISQILVYKDLGVSTESIKHTIATLSDIIDPSYHLVQTINADGIKHTNWEPLTLLLIIPGGADRFYHQKLHPDGNKKIKQFLEIGGGYLDICAFAYYSAETIEFAKGSSIEIIKPRHLGFFNGVVQGPILAPYVYGSYSGARAAHLYLHNSKDKTYSYTFYNGGGHFLDAEKSEDIHIMASYILPQKLKPAIIEVKVEKGKAMLSGVHFEYYSYLLDKKDPHLAAILPKLNQYYTHNIHLNIRLFKSLGLHLQIV